MASVNYGRMRPTPLHVTAHDNPVAVVAGTLHAAMAGPGGPKRPGGKRSPGVAGLGGVKPVPTLGDFKKPNKKAATNF